MESKNCPKRPDRLTKGLHTRMTALGMAALMASIPQLSHASDLKNALDSMFLSNSTSPGAYSSQTRGGFTAGSMVVRSPIKPITLVAFDPPRISGGCGGIDMFGGSFSFINSEQLVALFRAVVANAVSALFWMAIQNILPSLANVMSKFQSLISALNMGLKNTCALANQIIKPFSKNADITSSQSEKGIFESVTGAAKDLWGSVEKMFETGKTEPTVMKGGQNVGAKVSETYGNITWRALVRSNAAGGLTTGLDSGTNRVYNSPAGGDQLTMEIMQSMIGTVVRLDTGSGSYGMRATTDSTPAAPIQNPVTGDQTQSPDSTFAETMNSKAPADVILYEPTITSVQQFLLGPAPGETIQILACNVTNAATDETYCNSIFKKNLTREEWPGVQGMVFKHLLGSTDGVTSTENGLVHKLVNCNTSLNASSPCGFTTAQIALIETSSIPILALLKRAQGSPGLTESIAQQLAPVIAEDYAYRLMQSVVTAVGQSYSGVKGLSIPEVVTRNLTQIRSEFNGVSATRKRAMEQVNVSTAFIETAIKNLPNATAFR